MDAYIVHRLFIWETIGVTGQSLKNDNVWKNQTNKKAEKKWNRQHGKRVLESWKSWNERSSKEKNRGAVVALDMFSKMEGL